MKKLLFLFFLNIGLFAIGQTFSFSRVQIYESENLKKDTAENSVLKIEGDKIILNFNRKQFEYEIEDGDGIIYILKDSRKNTIKLSLEKGVCIIDDRKRIIILKS